MNSNTLNSDTQFLCYGAFPLVPPDRWRALARNEGGPSILPPKAPLVTHIATSLDLRQIGNQNLSLPRKDCKEGEMFWSVKSL